MENPITNTRRAVHEIHASGRAQVNDPVATERFVAEVRLLLTRLQSMPPAERNLTASSMAAADCRFLSGLVVDSAEFAIRNDDVHEIGWGLLAMLFNNPAHAAWVELASDFAALHYSARRVGYDLEGYYRSNRHLAIPEMQQLLDQYFDQGGLTLDQSGWAEGEDKEGNFRFTFRRSR